MSGRARPWVGHDPLRSGASKPSFRGLLAQKPSSERDRRPAYRDQPSYCGNAFQSQPCPRPYDLGPPQARRHGTLLLMQNGGPTPCRRTHCLYKSIADLAPLHGIDDAVAKGLRNAIVAPIILMKPITVRVADHVLKRHATLAMPIFHYLEPAK